MGKRRTNPVGRQRRSVAALAVFALVGGLALVASPLSADRADAAYATGGTGLYQGAIDWFEWGTPNTPVTSGATRTNTRVIDGQTLATTCSISSVAGVLRTYRPGAFAGDGLDNLYNIGGLGASNQLISGLANVNAGATVTFDFSCSVTLDGIPVDLPGLVVADAETSSTVGGEYIQATPDQDATWRIIDRHREGCATSTQAILSADDTLRLAPNGGWCSTGAGPMAVAYMEGATSAEVELHGGGVSAIALGVVLNADYGDAPASYGQAGSLFSANWAGGTVPVGTTLVSGAGFVLGTPGQPDPRLGATTDPEASPLFSPDATGDGADEDAVTAPDVPAAPGDSYTLADVDCTGPGYVSGWIDWNSNGVFDDTERSNVVECAATSVDLTWTVPENPQGGDRFMRLRIAPDEASASTPTGLTTSGEVEDYNISLDIPEVTCFSDPNVFNTGYDAETGGVLADGAIDANWDVAGPFGGDATYPVAMPPVDAAWRDANVGNLVPAAWDASPFGNAQWISGESMGDPQSPNGDWYYRYQFTLADDVDPSEFDLELDFLADNSVAEVFVNGAPQSGNTTGLPSSGASDPYNFGGFTVENAANTTLEDDWQNGANTVLVQVKSFASFEGFMTQARPGALCPTPDLSVTKSSDADADTRVGDTVTYTVTATNVGDAPYTAELPGSVTDDLSAVLDDAVFNNDAEVSFSEGSTSDAPTLVGSTLTWSGPLAVGEVATITYSVDLEAGGNGTVANEVCGPVGPLGEASCATTETLLPRLTVDKSADSAAIPAEGAPVTYTVVATNPGPGNYTGTAPAIITDDLAGVLDDAAFVSADATLGADPILDGETLVWTGALTVGQSVTITYTLTYSGDGDGELENVVCVPLDEALPGSPACDTVTIPGPVLSQSKSVDPASGTSVVPGQEVTYTLRFDNDGPAEAVISTTDDLSGVLDDADLIAGPVSSSAGLTASAPDGDGVVTISGDVPAASVVTITYTVRVLPFADQGDNVLGNVLACPAGDDDCEPSVTENPVRHLTVTKSAAPTDDIEPGDTVTYTVTITNDGTGDYPAETPAVVNDDLTDVLDDAVYNADADASDGVLSYLEPVLTWSHALPADTSESFTYSVIVTNAGDHDLVNTAGPVCAEPEICEPPVTNVVLLPHIVATKTSNPESGAALDAGDVVEYNLSFSNDGQATGPVNSTDNLSDVLDDAVLTGPIESSLPGITAVLEGAAILIAGDLDPTLTVTITYSVVINPDGDRGNNIVANVLAQATPPHLTCVDGECEPPEPPTTLHPLSELDDWKTVEPASGTVLRAGQEVVYTLHFENIGEANVVVNREDVLTRVLDDASVSSAPAASEVALTVSDITGERFGVSGVLEPDEYVTVTYRVTVLADADRGDSQMANFLVNAGDTPPASCEPGTDGRADCTVNAVLPALAITGGIIAWWAIAAALALLVLGAAAIVLAKRRSHQSSSDSETGRA